MRGFLASVALVVLAAVGCGHDGSVDITFLPTPPPIVAAVTGVVLAPNGEFAAAGGWWEWPAQLRLVQRAHALQNVLPAGGILEVTLSRIDLVDAKDGRIDTPLLLATGRTDGDGLYKIVHPAAGNLDDCRLIVAVGGGELLTRAFVVSHTTNIDAVSEAVVRVVLDRLTKAPPVQLCDFKTDGLLRILAKAQNAAFPAKGDSIAEINQDAFEHVRTNRNVKKAIDDATGVPVESP